MKRVREEGALGGPCALGTSGCPKTGGGSLTHKSERDFREESISVKRVRGEGALGGPCALGTSGAVRGARPPAARGRAGAQNPRRYMSFFQEYYYSLLRDVLYAPAVLPRANYFPNY